MTQAQREAIKELQALLRHHQRSSTEKYVTSKAKEVDITWGASRFFAELVYEVSPLESFWTLDRFTEFKQDYESKCCVSIGLQKLIDKHWLRVVLGYVQVPEVIRSATYVLDRSKEHRQELSFLVQVSESALEDRIDANDFEDALTVYQERHSVQLDRAYLEDNKFISNRDGQISISSAPYYKPILENWDEFTFIHAFLERKNANDDKGLLLTKGKFNKVYTKHKRFFIKTPSKEALISEEVIRIYNGGYLLSFRNPKTQYWDAIADASSGFLWELLMEDDGYKSDKLRLISWLEKVLCWPLWPRVLEHVTDDAKRRFLDAALDLVLTEPDLDGIQDEFIRLRLDDRIHGDTNIIDNPSALEEEKLDNRNHFELYQSLEDLDEKYQGNLLTVHGVRGNLAFIIKSIVTGDYEFETVHDGQDKPVNSHFIRVKQLLTESISKPYLLWETCHFIVRDNPAIIPYLLLEGDFESLAIKLIDQVSFPDEILDKGQSFKLRLWKGSMRLVLDAMISNSLIDRELQSHFIFQVFRQLNGDKYKVLSSYSSKKEHYDYRQEKREKEQEVLNLLENYPKSGYGVHQPSNNYFLPTILTELYSLFKSFNSKPKYYNGTIQFPMMQWDTIAWILKCSTYTRYSNQIKNQPLPVSEIAKEFLSLYLGKIEQNKVLKYNYASKTKEDGRPLWSERNERLELIEWIYPTYFIYKSGKLNDFLSPRFKFKNVDDEYDEDNNFNAQKLRTHIGVLLQILKQFSSPVKNPHLDKKVLDRIKVQIEDQIIIYIKKHDQSIPLEGRVDIFNYRFERQFQSSEKEALLPQLAQAINWFSEKEKVIKALAETNDVVRMLMIGHWITAEGGRRILIEKLKDSQINKFLKSQFWIPEIQIAMLKLTEYPELVEQAKKILMYWEKKILPAKKEAQYEQAAYQVRLLIAYHKRDEALMDRIPDLDSSATLPGEFTNEALREFYRGLIRIDTKPKESYQIFDNLLNRFKQDGTVALNRFAAKTRWALHDNDPSLFQEALDEWNDFAEANIDALAFDGIQEKIWVNTLEVYRNLEEHEKVEELYLSLDKPYRMLPDVLSIWMESLLDRKLDQQALRLMEDAQRYHQFSDWTEPEFISLLKLRVEGGDYIKSLQDSYNTIFAQEPSTLIKVFPPKLNGKEELKEFLTKEIAIACDKVLDKIRSVDMIGNEDKYNDLIQLTLEARINPWGWQVKDQSRGGKSAKGKNLGERDIIISDGNSHLVVCEAFIYRKPQIAKEHLKKVFNYHHNKQSFIILVYYLGLQSDFDKKWKAYRQSIVPKADVPKGFAMKSKYLLDVTKEFGYNASAIKIGRAKHGKETMLYHIYVNMNYQVN